MGDFNFYRFIAYLIGAIFLALLILKIYLVYSFKKLERADQKAPSDDSSRNTR
jgi:Ni,Fe-hydrogenase I cytochrome b subunit